jgi:hypothetical protein
MRAGQAGDRLFADKNREPLRWEFPVPPDYYPQGFNPVEMRQRLAAVAILIVFAVPHQFGSHHGKRVRI